MMGIIIAFVRHMPVFFRLFVQCQHSSGDFIQAVFGKPAVFRLLFQVILVPVYAAGHFHIKAGIKRSYMPSYGSPVGHHDAVKLQFSS